MLKYGTILQLWDAKNAPVYTTHNEALYNLDKAGGGINLAVGDVYVQAHTTLAENEEHDFTLFARNASGATTITSASIQSIALVLKTL